MDLIPDFIERRHGRATVEYVHPLLEGISRETYGVLIYQEQVMQAAQILSGYTLGGADLLRRAMGKKNPEVMAKMRGKFVKGAVEKGHPEKKAVHIFELMEHFAGYGFNKSHSTAYAFLAYQTAYLKANYPRHFAAALLTIEAANTDKLALYIAECRDRGHTPPAAMAIVRTACPGCQGSTVSRPPSTSDFPRARGTTTSR